MSKNFMPLVMDAPPEASDVLEDSDGRRAGHVVGASSVTIEAAWPDGARKYRVALLIAVDRDTARSLSMPEPIVPACFEMFEKSMMGIFGEEAVERAMEDMDREEERQALAEALRSLGLIVHLH